MKPIFLSPIKSFILSASLFCPAVCFADTTADPNGIVVNFTATIIQQSCTVGTITPVKFEDIQRDDDSGLGSNIGYASADSLTYFSLDVNCIAATGLNIKLVGTADTYNANSYLALDACSATKCAKGFGIATYMVTGENVEPTATNLLTPNANFTKSLADTTAAGVETTLWFAAQIIQTVNKGSVSSGTYTATATIQVRYD